MVKKIILWILLAACMTSIFGFSSQNSDISSATSGKLITSILSISRTFRELPDDEQAKIVSSFQHVARKGAHFTIYATLGMLIYLLMKAYRIKMALLLTPGVGALYAVTDEMHQTFIRGRSGELRDVIIDLCGSFCGALVGMLLYFLWRALKRGFRHG